MFLIEIGYSFNPHLMEIVEKTVYNVNEQTKEESP
jgi:hypothetical protein